MKHRISILLLAGALMVACALDSERARLMKEEYPTYPESIRQSIDGRHPMRGMTHNQLYLALGEPLCKTTANREGKKQEVWMYPPGGAFPCRSARFRVYFDDNGLVEGWKLVESP